jgi:aldose 1-epimerase
MISLEGMAEQYEIRGTGGMRVSFLDLGGIITGIHVRDRDGRTANMVVSCESVREYLADTSYLGAIVGRYANRIANARFTIDETEYRLRANDGENHLHGGPLGFHRVHWNVEMESPSAATLRHVSADGDEGYPGELSVMVRYSVTPEQALRVDYYATTTRATHVNLTQHSYFNLAGEGDILDHELTIHARHFTPVGSDLIPTGELKGVAGTPFDFTRLGTIGERLESDDPQLWIAGAFDHNLALDTRTLDETAVTLRDPKSGRRMEIQTTEPGIQFYSGLRRGVALETQHFPDSPNRPEFPSTLLRPGDFYRSTTIYAFSAF